MRRSIPDDAASFRWVAEHYPKHRFSVDPDALDDVPAPVTISLRASAPLGIPSASRLGELSCVAQHLICLARELS
jgi:hypothetical protein